jgi:HEAT repeat protein
MASAMTAEIHDLLRSAILATDPAERYVLTKRVGLIGVEPERDVPLLIELLDANNHWFARSLAVWELLKLGPDAKAAVPHFAALAAEKGTIIDPRWVSLWALERMGPAAAPAVPTMLELLRSEEDPDVRSEAAFALGASGVVEGVVSGLTEALSDADSLVREEAAAALGRIGPQAASSAAVLAEVAASDPVRPVREAAARALRRMNEPELAARAEHEAEEAAPQPPAELDGLLEKLRSDNPRTRAETAWPVGKLGSDAAPGLPVIVNQLRTDHDPDARWGAAWCVGRIGPAAADAVDDVIAAMRADPDPDVRAQAAQALGHIGVGSSKVIDALVAALQDESASMLREEALIALGRLAPASRVALPAIRERLIDPHRMVRTRAQSALAAVIGEI